MLSAQPRPGVQGEGPGRPARWEPESGQVVSQDVKSGCGRPVHHPAGSPAGARVNSSSQRCQGPAASTLLNLPSRSL